MAFDLEHARFTVGRLPGEHLPAIACEMLASGLDSPALAEVAGLSHPTLRDSAELFSRALRETGFPELTTEQAWAIVLRDVLDRISQSRVEPYAGALEVCSLWHDAGCSADYAVFVALADEYEEHPSDRAAVATEITRVARELLGSLAGGCPTSR